MASVSLTIENIFLICENTLSWNTWLIQPLDVPLYLHVGSALDLLGVTAWKEFVHELSGSGRFWMRQSILWITSFLTDEHVQPAKAPTGAHQDSNSRIPGLGTCWLLTGNKYMWWYVCCCLVTIKACPKVQKGEKRDGCSIGCQQDEGETELLCTQQGCEHFWSVSEKAWHAVKEQSRSSSWAGLALMGALPFNGYASLDIVCRSTARAEQRGLLEFLLICQ